MAPTAAGKKHLQTVIASGDSSKLSESQLRSALNAGVAAFKRQSSKAEKAMSIAQDVGGVLVTFLEVQTGAFGSGLLKGWFGDSLKLAGRFDVRIGMGGALAAWGLYDVVRGKGGHHQLSFASGILAVLVGEGGTWVGQAAKSRANGQAGAAAGLPPVPGAAPGALPPGAPPAGSMTMVNGPLREVNSLHAAAQQQTIQSGEPLNPFVHRMAA